MTLTTDLDTLDWGSEDDVRSFLAGIVDGGNWSAETAELTIKTADENGVGLDAIIDLIEQAGGTIE